MCVYIYIYIYIHTHICIYFRYFKKEVSKIDLQKQKTEWW